MTDAAAPPRAPWTLSRRLVLTVVAVLAVVSVVIATISVLVLWGTLMSGVDQQLASTISRGSTAVGIRPGQTPGTVELPSPIDIVSARGQNVGTLASVIDDTGTTQGAVYVTDDGRIGRLTDAQAAVLARVPSDGRAHTVALGGKVGDYRVVSLATAFDWTYVIGLPLASVNATVTQLSVVIAIVAILGVVIVGVLGTRIVRIALRPLNRVAETATRVSRLTLDRGEVALAERVPAEDADPRTEVGQVGAALNTMLEHVGDALTARQASEQKVRQFVADASHELRTPLASIRGYSELTRRTGERLPDDIAHALGRIESESVRMTGLVEDLLLLARLDEGRELAHEPVDLTLLLVDAVGDAHAAGPDHVWNLDVPEDPVEVLGDRPRLQQVVVNLLANARVHTPEGTTVTTALAVENGEAVLTVTDDGPGIPQAIAGTLFERFSRADASRARTTGSTGLGLAIVRAVVEAHGGTVGAASAEGETVFTVRLPLA